MSVLDVVFISLAKYGIGNIVAVKGGYLLNKLLNARTTVDIDLSYDNLSLWSNLKKAFIDCGEELKRSGVIATYEIREPQAEPKRSGGVVYKAENGIVVAGVDASVQDMGFGVHDVTIPIFDGVITEIVMQAYTFERMLGDKISATFSRQQFRRAKDLFDIYAIISTQTISHQGLWRALQDRSAENILNEDWKQFEFSPFREDALISWLQAWDKLRLDRGKGSTWQRPELQEVLTSYNVFLIGACEITSSFNGIMWDPKIKEWR